MKTPRTKPIWTCPECETHEFSVVELKRTRKVYAVDPLTGLIDYNHGSDDTRLMDGDFDDVKFIRCNECGYNDNYIEKVDTQNGSAFVAQIEGLRREDV